TTEIAIDPLSTIRVTAVGDPTTLFYRSTILGGWIIVCPKKETLRDSASPFFWIPRKKQLLKERLRLYSAVKVSLPGTFPRQCRRRESGKRRPAVKRYIVAIASFSKGHD
ncbi:MAG: hypothetical protein JTT11_03815, partial [Candidatus Brockarchaeota archaeon]|nr:hypothetical protein [Candidatus Brockarchaeota archaeon]